MLTDKLEHLAFMDHSFLRTQTQAIKDCYESKGYVVVKNLIASSKIDFFLKSLDALKSSRFYFYRTQDTNRFEKLKLDEEGFLEHSIMHPVDLPFKPVFRQAVANIICSEAVSDILALISGVQRQTLLQCIFFDKSTGTVAHQDHYYLDSDPPGQVVGCWYAMEKILPDCGPFFVVPQSHKGDLIRRDPNLPRFQDHESYVVKMKQLMEENNYQPLPMLIEPGDVIFWHMSTIHGALVNTSPYHSRKSLTAHYLPEGCSMMDWPAIAPRVPSFNPNILVWRKRRIEPIPTYLNYFSGALDVLLRSPDQLPPLEMKSSKYL